MYKIHFSTTFAEAPDTDKTDNPHLDRASSVASLWTESKFKRLVFKPPD